MYQLCFSYLPNFRAVLGLLVHRAHRGHLGEQERRASKAQRGRKATVVAMETWVLKEAW